MKITYYNVWKVTLKFSLVNNSCVYTFCFYWYNSHYYTKSTRRIMGVPKFFRYISERYPCLSEKLREFQIPEFDNLYLDMNGIIHVCSHPDDNPLQTIPEETIFKDIFYYIELMFRLIQPKKLFMMAVDGVAPRAKMNQQRGRRFRAAKDAELAAARVVANGACLAPEDRFDSNCITPGTEFMDRLHYQLKYFIIYKISTDKLWRRPKIILSGHDTPGEGEHKIMDYIRYLRTRDDWQPNTRHCLHGLDADLVMLGLCTHELHFSLLREEVKFGRNQKRPTNPEEISFELLHLSLMRDYLDLEFQALKERLHFPYDLEKIIDDWVLMGFLVGNDFIPNLPSLHINENALHNLYQLYIEVLPTLGGYINEAGLLNLERFEKYMNKLAEFDFEHFKEIESDLKYFEAKTSKKMRRSTDSLDECVTKNEELMNMINATKSALCDTEEDLIKWDDPDTEGDFMKEFTKFKAKYYMEKMHFKEVNEGMLQRQTECYVRAIQWNLHYYYHGCPSWSWHYPYHYAPFISDIKNFAQLGQPEFELGQPFQPFQQLLGVLPPASRTILPEAFRHLMVSPESPILHFYPENFHTDLNGKQHDWEAIVLLPFIDQDVLVAAMEPYYQDLTGDELRRNKHGPMTIYEYTSEDLGVREAPEYFPPVESNHAKETLVWLKEIKVPKDKLVWGLLPGARESFWYGFPTLKYIPFTGRLREAKVQVFQQPSRGLNMILSLKGIRGADEDLELANVKSVNLEEVAQKYLGKEVYVGWPHLVKALVTSITNTSCKFTVADNGEIINSDLTKDEFYYWSMYGQELAVRHRNKLGIEIGNVDIIVFAKQLIGAKYEFNEKGEPIKKLNWASSTTPYPLQTVVDDIKVLPCEKVCGGQPDVQVPLHALFPKGQVAFLMRTELYGVEVKVQETCNKGTVIVEVQNQAEPDTDSLYELKEENYEHYYQGSVAAPMCDLGSSHLLSRITGTVLIQTSEIDPYAKVNIGLNLKFNKSNQEVVGYTKKVDGRYWNYSDKAIQLIKEYVNKFPDVIRYLSNNNEDVFKKTDFFNSDDADTKIQEITKWLADHPYSKAERRNFNSDILSEVVVKELEKIVKSNSCKNENTTVLEVKPGELLLPLSQLNLMEPDPNAVHQLLDRVVNIRECHPVTLGLKGFIIGIEGKEDEQATLYDILFDFPIINGFQLHTEDKRCYRLTRHAFINLSHGRRKHLNAGQSSSKQKKRKAFTPKINIVSCGARFEDLKISIGNTSTPKASSTRPKIFNAKMEPNLRPDYSSGSNNVTKFFSAYRSPNFSNTLGQIHQGNQNQQSPNRQGGGFQSHQQPNANSEFQAMWNHLQHQKVPSENITLLQPNTSPSTKLSTAANEQTNALRKILKLRDSVGTSQPTNVSNNSGGQIQQQQPPPPPPTSSSSSSQHQPLRPEQHNALGRSPSQNQQKSCYHSHSCCAALINYCQRTGCAYPLYGYETNNATKAVSALICFPDGTQFRGQPAKDKLTAAENAACLTLKRLTEGKHFGGRQFVKFGGGATNLISSQQQPQPQQFHQQTIARLTSHMTDLPSPPHQWCQQQNKRESWRFQDTFQDNVQHRPSPSFSANSFVPLQAQVPRVQQNQHQQPNKSTNDNKAIISEQQEDINNKMPTTNSGGIIVLDKSSVTTPVQNEKVKAGKKTPQIGGQQNPELPIVIAPQVFMADNKKITTTATTTGIITTCQQQPPPPQQQQQPNQQIRKQFQKRTRSRLAARFSVPPSTPPSKE